MLANTNGNCETQISSLQKLLANTEGRSQERCSPTRVSAGEQAPRLSTGGLLGARLFRFHIGYWCSCLRFPSGSLFGSSSDGDDGDSMGYASAADTTSKDLPNLAAPNVGRGLRLVRPTSTKCPVPPPRYPLSWRGILYCFPRRWFLWIGYWAMVRPLMAWPY